MNKTEKWNLSDLRESPFQDDLFSDVSDRELEDLAEDLAAEGLHHPIEILPCGQIIDGHQRVRAARQLDWREIDVVIRDDLNDEVAVQRRMIAANLHRRQLSPIGIARAYRTLKRLERRNGGRRSPDDDRQDLRDRIASQLGSRSGRTLERLGRLLDTPRAVQDAVERGDLDMRHALRVVGNRQQNRIAIEIEAGEPPKRVVDRHVPPVSPPSISLYERYERLTNCLRQHVEHLEGREEEAAGMVMDQEEAEDLLSRSIGMLTALRDAEARGTLNRTRKTNCREVHVSRRLGMSPASLRADKEPQAWRSGRCDFHVATTGQLVQPSRDIEINVVGRTKASRSRADKEPRTCPIKHPPMSRNERR